MTLSALASTLGGTVTPICLRPLVGHPYQSASDLGELPREFDPPFAAVRAGEQLAVVAACEDQIGVCGMGREALHMCIWRDRKERRFPALAAVSGALYGAE